MLDTASNSSCQSHAPTLKESAGYAFGDDDTKKMQLVMQVGRCWVVHAAKLHSDFVHDNIDMGDLLRMQPRHENKADLVKGNLIWKEECGLESFFTRTEGEWSYQFGPANTTRKMECHMMLQEHCNTTSCAVSRALQIN